MDYVITVLDGELAVDRAALTVTADNRHKTYGDADPLLSHSVDASQLKYSDTAAVVTGVGLSTATGAQATAGSHVITLSGATAANYAIVSVDGTLSVDKAALTVTADDKSKTAGESDPALSYSVDASQLKYADDAGVVRDVTLTAPTGNGLPPGDYAIVAGQGTADNYELGFVDGRLTVKPSPSVKAENLATQTRVVTAPVVAPTPVSTGAAVVQPGSLTVIGGGLTVPVSSSGSAGSAGSPEGAGLSGGFGSSGGLGGGFGGGTSGGNAGFGSAGANGAGGGSAADGASGGAGGTGGAGRTNATTGTTGTGSTAGTAGATGAADAGGLVDTGGANAAGGAGGSAGITGDSSATGQSTGGTGGAGGASASASAGAGGGDGRLVAVRPISQISADPVRGVTFEAGAVFEKPAGSSVAFTATLADGTALPSWLKIDPQTGTLTGLPPAGSRDVFEVVVTAQSDAGQKAATRVTLESGAVR